MLICYDHGSKNLISIETLKISAKCVGMTKFKCFNYKSLSYLNILITQNLQASNLWSSIAKIVEF